MDCKVVEVKDVNGITSKDVDLITPIRQTFSGLSYDCDPDLLSNDEVYDDGDQAQWIQLSEIAAIQKKSQLLNAPESHPDFDGKTCLDCEDEIPKERLALHKIRCIECQRVIELRKKQMF